MHILLFLVSLICFLSTLFLFLFCLKNVMILRDTCVPLKVH